MIVEHVARVTTERQMSLGLVRRSGRGHHQRASENWALERDNDPMLGRAWDIPLIGRIAELVLHDALGAAVGGRPALAVLG